MTTEPTQIIRGQRHAAFNLWGWISIAVSIIGTALSFALLAHPRPGYFAAAILFALGAVACLHDDTIEIDTSSRRFRRRRGIRPFLRSQEDPIEDGSRIMLSTRSGVNFVGDPVSAGDVCFQSGSRQWRLASGDLGEMTSKAYEVAGWLRIPVDYAMGSGPI